MNAQEAMAAIEARGYLWDVGQLSREARRFLWRMGKLGRIRKSAAFWPWFSEGTARKPVYHLPDFDPADGTLVSNQ